MMKPIFSYTSLLLLVLACTMSACNDPTDLGADLIGEGDHVSAHFTDTLSLSVSLEKSDSLLTGPSVFSRPYLLGSLNDPVFGVSSAGIHTQVRLPANDIKLGDNPVPDSLVITLAYDTGAELYGDTLANNNLVVYELLDSLILGVLPTDTTESSTQNYFSDEVFNTGNIELGRKSNFAFNTADATEIEENVSLAHLRIKLDDAFAQSWIDRFSSPEDSTLDNNANFLDFFKGFYIRPDNNLENNAIIAFSLASEFSRLTLFYSNDSTSNLTQHFVIDGSTAAVNTFRHDFDETQVKDVLTSKPSEVNNFGYLKAMGGVNLKIDIPYLSNLGDVIVNKAELEVYNIPNDNWQDGIFPPPDQLRSGVLNKATDATSFNSDILRVSERELLIDSTGTSFHLYRVNLNYTLSELILDNDDGNKLMTLFITPNSTIADRVIVTGPQHPDYPMKLNLYYTEIQ